MLLSKWLEYDVKSGYAQILGTGLYNGRMVAATYVREDDIFLMYNDQNYAMTTGEVAFEI